MRARSRRQTIVFGLLKRGDKVYTAIVPNAGKAALRAVIRGRASLSSVVHTDGWAAYHGLVDLGFDKHLRVEHRDDIFAQQLNHINGMRASGASPNDASRASAACPNMPSVCTSKRQNCASIIGITTSTKSC